MARVSVAELKNRVASRVDRTIEREAIDGLKQAAMVRCAAMAAIGIWIAFQVPFPEASYYLLALAAFTAIGLAHRLVIERHPMLAWPGFVFLTADVCLLAYILVFPNPLADQPWPVQMSLRLGNFPYFYVFLAGALLTYSPKQVVWAGTVIALTWSAVIAWIVTLPNTIVFQQNLTWHEMPADMRLRTLLDPQFIDMTGAFKDVFLVLVVTAILASAVWRMRRLAFQQADAERQRANLARYFSPNLVEELTRQDDTLDDEQEIAVMFLDIRGFTAFAEQLPLKNTLELLRNFHSRMSEEVFSHNGTLDKYIGDGLMATFGAPKKGPRDAANAIQCALAMRNRIVAWNAEREAQGYRPIEIGIGVHFGRVVMGDIGSEGRMEFAVIGDTVNVASRIEHLTRELDTAIALSDSVVAAAHAELGLDDPIFDGFREAPEQHLRGRLIGMIVWTYDEAIAEEDRLRRMESIDLAPASP